MVIGPSGVGLWSYEWQPCRSSRVWLQTELDDTKSYYQLITKITIPEKQK